MRLDQARIFNIYMRWTFGRIYIIYTKGFHFYVFTLKYLQSFVGLLDCSPLTHPSTENRPRLDGIATPVEVHVSVVSDIILLYMIRRQ